MIYQTPDYFLILFLLSILSISAIIDFRAQKIPNLITLPAVIIALLYHFFTNGIDGLTFSALGLAAGIGLLIIPYMLGGMGAGDAKLMGAVGAILGTKSVFTAFPSTVELSGAYMRLSSYCLTENSLMVFFKKQFITLQLFVLTRKFIPDP